jgi:hypothetical protein
MSKAKAKSGTGKGTGTGTGKKGWNRWKAGANKAKSFKPYTSKGNKTGSKTTSSNDGE